MKILIVDDEPELLMQLEKLMARLGHEVRCASNGREALEILTKEQHELHLVLSDIRMPDIDGLGLARGMEELQINVPLAFMTGHGDANLACEAIKANAFDFCTKPFGVRELRQLLSKVSVVYEDDSDDEAHWEETHNGYECTVISATGLIGSVATQLEAKLSAYLMEGGLPSKAYALTFAEALRNAMTHGSDGLDMAMVQISVRCGLGQIVARIEDEGPGFDFVNAGSAPRALDAEAPQRGLFIIKNWMDSVTFGGPGNSITMARRLPRAEALRGLVA